LYNEWALPLLPRLGAGSLRDRIAPNKGKQTGEDAKPDGPVEEGGLVNSGVYRMLKHLTYDPRLGIMTEMNHAHMSSRDKTEAAKARRNNWTGVDMDHGASFFFAKTRHSRMYGIPQDRLTMATYLAGMSVKARWALGQIAENLENGEGTAIGFEYPMTRW
jgi:hypothetical protein